MQKQGRRSQVIPSRSIAKPLLNSSSVALSVTSVVATVAALLPSAGGREISSSSRDSRSSDSNVGGSTAWLAARALRGSRRNVSGDCELSTSMAWLAVLPLDRDCFEVLGA